MPSHPAIENQNKVFAHVKHVAKSFCKKHRHELSREYVQTVMEELKSGIYVLKRGRGKIL